MRLLADAHVSPRTVEFLCTLGHDVQRVADVLPLASPDETIVHLAVRDTRIILTQDLDFSAIIALGGERFPSLISLRLSSSRIERVNSVLERVLPQIEACPTGGEYRHGRRSADTGSGTSAVIVNHDLDRLPTSRKALSARSTDAHRVLNCQIANSPIQPMGPGYNPTR